MRRLQEILMVVSILSVILLGGCFDQRTEEEKAVDSLKEKVEELGDKAVDVVHEVGNVLEEM